MRAALGLVVLPHMPHHSRSVNAQATKTSQPRPAWLAKHNKGKQSKAASQARTWEGHTVVQAGSGKRLQVLACSQPGGAHRSEMHAQANPARKGPVTWPQTPLSGLPGTPRHTHTQPHNWHPPLESERAMRCDTPWAPAKSPSRLLGRHSSCGSPPPAPCAKLPTSASPMPTTISPCSSPRAPVGDQWETQQQRSKSVKHWLRAAAGRGSVVLEGSTHRGPQAGRQPAGCWSASRSSRHSPARCSQPTCQGVCGVQYERVLRRHHLLQQHSHVQVCSRSRVGAGWGRVEDMEA